MHKHGCVTASDCVFRVTPLYTQWNTLDVRLRWSLMESFTNSNLTDGEPVGILVRWSLKRGGHLERWSLKTGGHLREVVT